MILLTKEQLWYVCNVYPERVTVREARKVFYEKISQHDDPVKGIDIESYWETARKIIYGLEEEIRRPNLGSNRLGIAKSITESESKDRKRFGIPDKNSTAEDINDE